MGQIFYTNNTMSLTEVYENPQVSTMEEKFQVVKLEDNVYEGKYPLEMVLKGMRGIFGGEFVSQAIVAIWETIEDPSFSPHSIHSYFLKAGSPDSPIRWEIQTKNEGRSFINKEANGYQSHTNTLCFTLTASFAKNNSIKQRKIEYEEKTKSETDAEKLAKLPVPYEFQRTPHYFFKKYFKRLDEMSYIETINGNIRHIIPPEIFQKGKDDHKAIGHRDLGFFFKIVDDLSLAKRPERMKFVELSFASDAIYLSLLTRAMGMAFSPKAASYFRVSLDHTLYFHDDDFDPTQWMFLDFRFNRMSNNRVLCQCHVFTSDERMVLTIIQEALVYIPIESVERATGGTHKL